MRIIAGCAWQLELSHQCLQIRGRAHLNSGEPKIPHEQDCRKWSRPGSFRGNSSPRVHSHASMKLPIMTRILTYLAGLIASAHASAPVLERASNSSGQVSPDCRRAVCTFTAIAFSMSDMLLVFSTFLDFWICLPLASQ